MSILYLSAKRFLNFGVQCMDSDTKVKYFAHAILLKSKNYTNMKLSNVSDTLTVFFLNWKQTTQVIIWISNQNDIYHHVNQYT